MAVSNWGVNHPLARKHWAAKLMTETLKMVQVMNMASKGTNSLIYVKDETSKGKGDKITYGLRTQLTGRGVLGDDTLEGQEEALNLHTDSLVINQHRHAVNAGGKMSRQRVPFESRQECMDGLADWWKHRFETALFNHLCSNDTETDLAFTGNNAVTAADANHRVVASEHSTTASLSTTSTFKLLDIDHAIEKGKTQAIGGNGNLRQIKVDGSNYWVCFIHPYQMTDLRTNSADGQWLDLQKNAGARGSDNPIWSDVAGVYRDVLIKESWYVPTGPATGSGATRRAVLCGAQAICMAFGRGDSMTQLDWVEKVFDYENILNVKAGCIFGAKKSTFNSEDVGTIQILTAANAHA
jgi:N4-gp56 family major capsid protein